MIDISTLVCYPPQLRVAIKRKDSQPFKHEKVIGVSSTPNEWVEDTVIEEVRHVIVDIDLKNGGFKRLCQIYWDILEGRAVRI